MYHLCGLIKKHLKPIRIQLNTNLSTSCKSNTSQLVSFVSFFIFFPPNPGTLNWDPQPSDLQQSLVGISLIEKFPSLCFDCGYSTQKTTPGIVSFKSFPIFVTGSAITLPVKLASLRSFHLRAYPLTPPRKHVLRFYIVTLSFSLTNQLNSFLSRLNL